MRPLLSPAEPPACRVEREHGKSPFFVICDHAGALIPRTLGALGLAPADRLRHIAWDIGAAAVSSGMGDRFDATVVLQTYSRLVIDCNRHVGTPSSITATSERTRIPGNEALTRDDAERRFNEVWRPYHERIAALLDARRARGQRTWLISMHSFTPVFLGEPRPWHVGILYNRDARLAQALLDVLARERGLVVGENEPYAVSDDTDYAIPVYGEKRGLAHVEIEVRQDLIEAPAGQREWAERLALALGEAARCLD